MKNAAIRIRYNGKAQKKLNNSEIMNGTWVCNSMSMRKVFKRQTIPLSDLRSQHFVTALNLTLLLMKRIYGDIYFRNNEIN